MTAITPAPTYILAPAAWVPTLVIWHAGGRSTRLEGDPCDDYAAALAASWRLRPSSTLTRLSPRPTSRQRPHVRLW